MRNKSNSSPTLLQQTILANRAAKHRVTCPECGAATRDALRHGNQLWRICSTRSCTWSGEHLVEAEAAARAANVAMAGKGGVAA